MVESQIPHPHNTGEMSMNEESQNKPSAPQSRPEEFAPVASSHPTSSNVGGQVKLGTDHAERVFPVRDAGQGGVAVLDSDDPPQLPEDPGGNVPYRQIPQPTPDKEG